MLFDQRLMRLMTVLGLACGAGVAHATFASDSTQISFASATTTASAGSFLGLGSFSRTMWVLPNAEATPGASFAGGTPASFSGADSAAPSEAVGGLFFDAGNAATALADQEATTPSTLGAFESHGMSLAETFRTLVKGATELEIYALMLIGLGAIGLLARRKEVVSVPQLNQRFSG